MDVTVIGAGNMARGIATRLVAGGNTVTITGKDATKTAALAAEVGARSGEDSAIDSAEVVVLAVPFAAAKELVAAYSTRLGGKIVVDISNPVNATLDGLVTPPGTSAAAEIAAAADPGARIVKAFNTTFAGALTAGDVGGTPLDVFIAGDDESARKAVAELVASGGPNPVDAGPLEWARALEGFQLLHMSLQLRGPGFGWASAIKLVTP